MADAFSDFLSSPSGESFLRLREEVMAQPDYDFASDGLAELHALVSNGDHAAVPAKLAELMPDWLLSPRAHQLAAHAAGQLGDGERADSEQAFSRACLFGLRDSGDGSPERPYRVTHVDDEYDLLEAVGRTVSSHRQLTRTDGVFDLLSCDDGSELWFDVTGATR